MPDNTLLNKIFNLEQLIKRHKHEGVEDEQLNNGVERIVVSFETGEQYNLNLYVPFGIRIKKLRGRTIKAIAATDNGTIVIKNSDGNTMATLTATASTAIDTDLTEVLPTDNSQIPKGDYYEIETAKTTAGGKVLVSIEWERL